MGEKLKDSEGFHIPNWFKMLLLFAALTLTYPVNIFGLNVFTYLTFSTIALSTFGMYLKLSKYLEQEVELKKEIEVLKHR